MNLFHIATACHLMAQLQQQTATDQLAATIKKLKSIEQAYLTSCLLCTYVCLVGYMLHLCAAMAKPIQ